MGSGRLTWLARTSVSMALVAAAVTWQGVQAPRAAQAQTGDSATQALVAKAVGRLGALAGTTADADVAGTASRATPKVSGIAESVAGKGDGHISGLTAGMEVASTVDEVFVPVVDPHEDFQAGVYLVRFAATTDRAASPEAVAVVVAGPKLVTTFVADDTIVDVQSLDWGADATLPEIPKKAGYDQVSPTWDRDGKGIVSDMTINAQYVKNVTSGMGVVAHEGNWGGARLVDGESGLVDAVPLTLDEHTRIGNGESMSLWVEARELASSEAAEDRMAVEGIRGAWVAGRFLDVCLYKRLGSADAKARRLAELNRPVRVHLGLPDDLPAVADGARRSYAVIRVHEGVAAFVECSVDAGADGLTFSSDRFSTYAIVYQDVPDGAMDPGDDGSTGPGEGTGIAIGTEEEDGGAQARDDAGDGSRDGSTAHDGAVSDADGQGAPMDGDGKSAAPNAAPIPQRAYVPLQTADVQAASVPAASAQPQVASLPTTDETQKLARTDDPFFGAALPTLLFSGLSCLVAGMAMRLRCLRLGR